jgi:hypothetical protein
MVGARAHDAVVNKTQRSSWTCQTKRRNKMTFSDLKKSVNICAGKLGRGRLPAGNTESEVRITLSYIQRRFSIT